MGPALLPMSIQSLPQAADHYNKLRSPVLEIQILVHFNYAGRCSLPEFYYVCMQAYSNRKHTPCLLSGLYTRYQSRIDQHKLLLGSEERTTMAKLEIDVCILYLPSFLIEIFAFLLIP